MFTMLAILPLLTSTAALASDETDLPDDILGGDTPETSARDQKRQLLEEEAAVELPDEKDKKRVIQTFQRKNFMKIGRYEVAPHVGFVSNDPFLNRYLLGAAFTYHPTELLGVEVTADYSPNLGDLDLKAVTKEIILNNGVTPDISKINFYSTVNLTFSPIYGKLAAGQSRIIAFDIFGLFGTGVVNTLDDLEALQKTDDPRAQASQNQFHPALSYGGGLRVLLNESFAIRAEGRGLSFIEVLESTTLEMKNNFTIVGGVSLFFPGMK
jgi:outer membrane beta-barrel protein